MSPPPETGGWSRQFGGLSVGGDDDLLIPRSWTSLQSRWAAELCRTAPPGPVLELCCGAGHIGQAALLELPPESLDRRLVQVDVFEPACRRSRSNARANELAHRVDVLCCDVADWPLRAAGRFAVVIADPPYVRTQDCGLHPEDPMRAIDGGDDGMAVLRSLRGPMLDAVHPDGHVLVQTAGAEQAQHLAAEWEGLLELCEVRSHDEQRAVARFAPAPGSSHTAHRPQ